MSTLHQVTEGALRQMAREASAMHFDQGEDLTNAVVKVASSYEYPLTSEHVRRVCEMTYHDVFERSFRDSDTPSKVVSFDPPEASKVAAAVRAQQITSMHEKAASARTARQEEVEKVASMPEVWTPPRPKNAFSAAVEKFAESPEVRRLEARSLLRDADASVKEAEHQIRVELGTIKSAQLSAYQELGRQVRQEVINGFPAERVLAACEYFMKEAGAPDEVVEGVIVDLAADMLWAGIDLNEKCASLRTVSPNKRHPLFPKASKVANLRTQRLHREYALEEILAGRARVEQELKSALFA